MNAPSPSSAAPRRELTLLDSTSIIVGIVIGAGIYEATPLIASSVTSTLWLIFMWLVGGLMALIGALCYAELTTAYPKEGGDYVYLTRAFGRRIGFVFSWAQFWVVRPGSIGAMAYIFGRYANELWPLDAWVGQAFPRMTYAAAAIVVLSLLNILGVREGKWTQNILTVIKVVGLLAIFAVALLAAEPAAVGPVAQQVERPGDFRLALILILFTYGGWNDMAYVAAEVRNPQKNLVRALVLGTSAITAIYVLVTIAFLHMLGFDGVRNASAVAAQAVEGPLGPWGVRAISVLICISCLGAINGMVFTGARIYYATGTEHPLFARLGVWSERFGTPARSLVLQAAVTLALVVGFGLGTEDGFTKMVIFTTPVFWFFFLLTGISLFVLRHKDRQTPRPYRVLAYPVTPIVFCLSCLFMLYTSLDYAWDNWSAEAFWSLALLAAGFVVSLLVVRSDRPGR